MENELIYYVTFGVLSTVLLLWSAVEDWKEWSVHGYLVLGCWLVAIIMAALHPQRNWMSVMLVVFMAILCYLPFEIPVFGDADIIPFAFYVAYFNPFAWVSTLSIILWLVLLLASLPIYGKLWAHAHGDTWHWGDKKPMPMLPCFAMAWVPAVIIYLVYVWLV